MHPAGEIWSICLGDEMEMIVHQDERDDGNFESSRRLAEEFNETISIRIADENLLPRITPSADVIYRTGEFDS